MKNKIDICLKSAVEAGSAIMQVYLHEDFNVEMKADDSPLTKADKMAHKVIMNHLQETGYPVLSEEGSRIDYEERKQWDKFWLVDPLDGTKEFISRNGDFTVNIALISDGNPVAGIIFVPVKSDLYLGIAGEGAWKININDNAFKPAGEFIKSHGEEIQADPDIPDKLVIAGSRSHMNEETKQYIKSMEKTYGEVELISRGSSLKLCMVAEGKAHIYPRFGPTMEWDTGAGHAIVNAAGGIVLDAKSKKALRYNKVDLHNPWFVVKHKEAVY